MWREGAGGLDKGREQKPEGGTLLQQSPSARRLQLAPPSCVGLEEANDFGYGSHDLADLAGNLQPVQGRSTRERAEGDRIYLEKPTRNDAFPIDSPNQLPTSPSLHLSVQ